MAKFFMVLGLVVFLFGASCTQNNPAVPVTPTNNNTGYSWDKFVMGADMSFTNQVQDYGGVYSDSGKVRDPFRIMKDHGCNLVRVRLWNNPSWQASLNGGKLYSDLADVAMTIKRAKAAGMVVNLDLHYSDTWADPGNQKIPAAWKGLSLSVMGDSVYNYTLGVLNTLKSQGLTPEMIQLGNETNSGMLWDVGKVTNNNWVAFASLLNKGIKAVRDFSATSTIKPQIILHVAQLQNGDYWAGGVTGAGVTDFDVLGLSHYYNYSTVNTMGQVSSTISSLKSKYGKKVMIVEAAYPWTSANADSYPNLYSSSTAVAGYDVSKDGQYKYMVDLTQAVIAGGGTGVMYWEPEWITSTLKDGFGQGSPWDNMTLFDFTGNTIQGIGYMNYGYKF